MSDIVLVYAVNCGSYEQECIQNAMDDLFAQMGGVQAVIPAGAKVFVKVNLVREMPPERCGTTHPEAVTALVRQLQNVTSDITIGDSSAGLYSKGVMTSVYAKCGMTRVEQCTAARLNRNFDSECVRIDGEVLSDCEITSDFSAADVVVNFTKLKTHSFTGYTGAVKNLFGLIPGLVKVEMHSRFPQLTDFCKLLCDLEHFARNKIVLHIIDAVWGMDGEGPTNGKPKFIGKLLASPDPYALDAVAVSLFANPLDMPVLREAVRRGYLQEDLSNVGFDFAAWKNSYIADFDVSPTQDVDFFRNMPSWVRKLAMRYMVRSVYMDANCRSCGKCAAHCPAKAITVQAGKRAKVDRKKCIHCYCCQELCPFNAVRFRKPLLYRLARRRSGAHSDKQ